MKKTGKRLLALFMSVCLCLTMIPAAAAEAIEIIETPAESELSGGTDEQIALVDPEESGETAPAADAELQSADGIAIDGETFPDDAFRAWVSENCDTDGDGALSEEEIAAIREIDVRNRNISSLRGIEAFPALETLWCSDNALTELDMSNNTALTVLGCERNQLTALDVTPLLGLIQLSCESNQLSTLNVSQNPALTNLYCGFNRLTELDVSSNTGLLGLYCPGNQLSALNVTNNSALVSLSCNNNQLSELDVTQNTALAELYCNENQLTELDVSNNTGLNYLSCTYNQLTGLDLSRNAMLITLCCADNSLSGLDVSRNTALTTLDCGWNLLQVLDVSTLPELQYLDCRNNQLAGLDVSRNTALTMLECGWNPLQVLDVSTLPELQILGCQESLLSELDLSNNTELCALFCGCNQLTEIDVTMLPELNSLAVETNLLTELNLSNNPELYWLSCLNNELTALDVSACPALVTAITVGERNDRGSFWEYRYTPANSNEYYLGVDKGVQLTPPDEREPEVEIPIDGETFPDDAFRAWVSENCDTDGDGALSEEEIANVVDIDVSDRDIESLAGIEIFTALNRLWCFDNQLSALNLSQSENLTWLDCGGNPLTELNLSQNKALTYLDCQCCQLIELDLSQNPVLIYLNCSNNQLTELDFSQNTALITLNCCSNPLTAFDVSMLTGLKVLICQAISLTELNLSNNPELYWLSCLNNELTALDVSVCPALVTAITVGERNDYGSSWEYRYTTEDSGDYYLGVDKGVQLTPPDEREPEAEIAIDGETFPDDAFRAWVSENCDSDGDGALSEGEISNVVDIDVSSRDIESLTGIETFTALTQLDCSWNPLMELDLSGMPKLEQLVCRGNQLSALDLSQNTSLTDLFAGNNQLTELDVSMLPELNWLECDYNALTELDVSNNTVLSALNCGDNQLTTLDLSQNTALTVLDIGYNPLTEFDLSALTELQSLECQDLSLSELDLSNNPKLCSLFCGGNQLTEIDVTMLPELSSLAVEGNLLTELDLSNNPELNWLSCTGNELTALDVSACPALVTAITVGERNDYGSFWEYRYTPENSGDYYLSVDKGVQLTPADEREPEAKIAIDGETFPDDSFRAWVSENCDTDGNGLLSDGETAAVTVIDVNNRGISSLTGIEIFTALEELWCYDNQLTELDLSSFPRLRMLYLGHNQVSSLDLSSCQQLQYLSCDNNQLTELDLSPCPALFSLDCASNSLTELDLTKTPALAELWCYDNQLTELDVTVLPALTRLICSRNPLGALDVTQNPMLEELNCYDIQMNGLDVSQNPALTSLNCSENQLTELNLSQNTNLTQLVCHENQLATLILPQYSPIDFIFCGDNQLTELDVSKQPNLRSLYCFGNQLTELDVTHNPELQDLGCYVNQLTELNLSQNTALVSLHCGMNQLTELDVSIAASLEELYCYDNRLTALDVTHNPALKKLSVFINPLTALDLSANSALYCLDCFKTNIETLDLTGCPLLLTMIRENTPEEYDIFWEYNYTVGEEECRSQLGKEMRLIVESMPTIVMQPESVSAVLDTTATFTVAAEGSGLSYQWQFRTSSTGSWSNSTLTGCKTASMNVKATESRSGYQYRCKISNSAGTVISDAATLTVIVPPVIKTQPKSVSVVVDNTVTFKVAAEGTGLSYQWQYRTSSTGSWNNSTMTGFDTAGMSVKATESRSGYQYRCLVTNSAGTTTSDTATLTVITKPTITTQPSSSSGVVGSTVKFTVKASGKNLSYQWQYRTSSTGSWNNSTASTAKTATIAVGAESHRNGYQYRCKVSNAAGTVTSNAATLTVITKPTIKTQPQPVSSVVDKTAKITVKASGTGLSYQWQYRSSSTGTWSNTTLTGNKTATLSVKATAARNGYQYRCKVTNAAGTVTSDAATLTVITKPTFTRQPEDISGQVDYSAVFAISTTGIDVSYQWQYRTSSTGTWYDSSLTGYDSPVLSFKITTARDGYQYRCKVTNPAGTVISDVATLIVITKPTITKQPASTIMVNAGKNAEFTVAAKGNELSYQWQYRTSSTGEWKNSTASTAKSATFVVAGESYRNGYQYRCKVTNEAGSATSNAATLKIKPVIKTHPVSVTASLGVSVIFGVEVNGPDLKYQWQYRTSSTGSWSNSTLTGCKTNILTVKVTEARDGYEYRCVITSPNGTVTSNAATLKILR